MKVLSGNAACRGADSRSSHARHLAWQSRPRCLAGRPRSNADDGFTLIEMAMVMAIMLVLVVLAAPPFAAWQKAQAYKTAVDEVIADLRLARTRAVSEATTVQVYGVSFTEGSGTVEVFSGTPTDVVSSRTLEGNAYVSDVQCITPNAAVPDGNCYFYGSGHASDGYVEIRGEDSDASEDCDVAKHCKRVTISGLTGVVEREDD